MNLYVSIEIHLHDAILLLLHSSSFALSRGRQEYLIGGVRGATESSPPKKRRASMRYASYVTEVAKPRTRIDASQVIHITRFVQMRSLPIATVHNALDVQTATHFRQASDRRARVVCTSRWCISSRTGQSRPISYSCSCGRPARRSSTPRTLQTYPGRLFPIPLPFP